MSDSSPLQRLHDECAQLHQRAPSTLTAEERNSLMYFRTEISINTGSDLPEGATDAIAEWTRFVLALESFSIQHCRMPRENNRPAARAEISVERKLSNKVRAQRRALVAGRLDSYRQRRLSCIEGFSFSPLEERWASNLTAYKNFTIGSSGAPKLRSSEAESRKLAAWAAKQRFQYRNGQLAEHRIDALNALDFWTWGERL